MAARSKDFWSGALIRRYALVAILAVAAILRLWGLTWGLPTATHYFSYHPDESTVLQVAMFNMNVFTGKLLPHFYDYGSLQIYLVNFANSAAFLFGAVDIVPKDFATWYPQWARMYLIGRSLTVAMGIGTVWATYALGRTLWGQRAGLMAAMLLAVMPLHAQHSHWLTVDVPATFWVTLSLLWTAKLAQEPALLRQRLRCAIFAGIFCGLAAATKYNMALVIIPLIAFCIVRQASAASATKLAAVACITAVAAFLIACPGAILESHQFIADFHKEAVHVSNFNDPTFKDTGSGFLFLITNNLDSGLGMPLLAVALIAVAYGLYRRRPADGLLAFFALPYYILISLAAVRYARYVIPLLPILALWTGRLIADLSRVKSPPRRRAVAAAGVVLLAWTLADAVLLVRPMAQIDPRDQALAWLAPRISGSQSVGFAAMPWFGTPPLNPYFSSPRPGAWEQIEQSAPSGLLRPGQILYHNMDWDLSVLAARPAWVVLSEYDYRNSVRLHDPHMVQFLAALNQNYTKSFVSPAVSWPVGVGEYGLPLHRLPHDMLYTNPEILIYQRK